ncbi:DUF1048 domain-containing protein [Actinospica durhamensis]|uniref:DUF1048 domain-containing protein n=1 Tax=Actinospica durhamensis TaxID=1508375 RepID=A0A941EWQ4_9ACTN|nr:DUF1048 domain-containing protein [Actinospica durhamensis]MBR7836379.1 DUF1048 domain-containing protein [Actinospica durhamensis]
MNFWQTITGSDLSRDWKAFEARAEALPEDYRAAWSQIKAELMGHGDFTGRNLTPIVDAVLGLLEESAQEGQDIHEVLDGDIKGFCAALVGGEDAQTYRDRWRRQLNRNVAKKLGRLGG